MQFSRQEIVESIANSPVVEDAEAEYNIDAINTEVNQIEWSEEYSTIEAEQEIYWGIVAKHAK